MAAPRIPESRRAQCQALLQEAGASSKAAAEYCRAASSALDFYGLERAVRLLHAMLEEEVLPHVALSIVRERAGCGAE